MYGNMSKVLTGQFFNQNISFIMCLTMEWENDLELTLGRLGLIIVPKYHEYGASDLVGFYYKSVWDVSGQRIRKGVLCYRVFIKKLTKVGML